MTESMYSVFNIIAAIVIGVLMIISGFVLKPTAFNDENKKIHTKT